MDSKKLDSYVNPKHYNVYKIDLAPIDFIEELPYNLASACKYLFRLGKKDNVEIEVGKINWYLDRAWERNEYSKVPAYLHKLAPMGGDVINSLIRAIANGSNCLAEDLRQKLNEEYATTDIPTEAKNSREFHKSNRMYNLSINNEFFFKLCDKGLLFSRTPIEEGNENVNEVDINTLPGDIYTELNKYLDDEQLPDQDKIVDTFKKIIANLNEEAEDDNPF